MDYSGSPSERAVPAGELDRRHVGQSVSFQPNDFTVVFGTIAGIARTEALVYLSLDGVGGGTHLKDEYDLPIDRNVYLQLDPLSSAEKGLADAAKAVKDKLDEFGRNIRDREQGKESE
ncbi:hypothetical protein AAHB33_08260 [Paenarthrobacter sp. S56]|uniref:hypothetical protein n=1 Tax=Paenarthrobacter sp. S56 TaxID=3138179 RepID=UPI0032199F14